MVSSFTYLLVQLISHSGPAAQSLHGAKSEILFYYWLRFKAPGANNSAREQKAVLETENCAETSKKKRK